MNGFAFVYYLPMCRSIAFVKDSVIVFDATSKAKQISPSESLLMIPPIGWNFD